MGTERRHGGVGSSLELRQFLHITIRGDVFGQRCIRMGVGSSGNFVDIL